MVFSNSQASNHDHWMHGIAVARGRYKYHKTVRVSSVSGYNEASHIPVPEWTQCLQQLQRRTVKLPHVRGGGGGVVYPRNPGWWGLFFKGLTPLNKSGRGVFGNNEAPHIPVPKRTKCLQKKKRRNVKLPQGGGGGGVDRHQEPRCWATCLQGDTPLQQQRTGLLWEDVPWRTEKKHEAVCPYRLYEWLVAKENGCTWAGCRSDTLHHTEEKHDKYIYRSEIFLVILVTNQLNTQTHFL